MRYLQVATIALVALMSGCGRGAMPPMPDTPASANSTHGAYSVRLANDMASGTAMVSEATTCNEEPFAPKVTNLNGGQSITVESDSVDCLDSGSTLWEFNSADGPYTCTASVHYDAANKHIVVRLKDALPYKGWRSQCSLSKDADGVTAVHYRFAP